MKNIKTLLRGSIVALMLVTPAWASPKTVTLNVSGMTCAACPITVKKALEKVPGVSSVDVRFEKKQVLVTFDDTKTNPRSEEHTSELQSQSNLVCRLLLE